MTKLLGAFATSVLLAAFACGSPAYDSPECLGALGVSSGTSACSSCQQSSCGSQYSDAENGCSGFLMCICPGGTLTPSNAEQCDMELSDPSCAVPLQALEKCLNTHCASSC